MQTATEPLAVGTGWRRLYEIGGAAALMAGVIFRRNLGVEIALFSAQKQPERVHDWFSLLQTHRLLGLAYLNIFDIMNDVLLAVMFLALAAILIKSNPSLVVLAAMFCFVGIAVHLASNTALSMLALSDQYTAATGEAQKDTLLASGQALLALNRFSSPGAHPGSAGYLSLLLIAAGGLLFSLVMLQTPSFKRFAAYCGLAANALDLLYCLAFIFTSANMSGFFAVLFIPAAGFFFMVWHILISCGLLQKRRLT